METKKFGRICKEYMVKEMAEYLKEYPDFFVSSFSQIAVSEVEKLRKAFKRDSALFMMVKNSLLKRALEISKTDIDTERLSGFIKGSCGILFSKSDPATTAKKLVGFSKENETFKIQGGFISGETVSSEVIKHLATLPSRDVLLAMVASGIKAPISGFVGILGNLIRNLVGVLDQIRQKKE